MYCAYCPSKIITSWDSYIELENASAEPSRQTENTFVKFGKNQLLAYSFFLQNSSAVSSRYSYRGHADLILILLDSSLTVTGDVGHFIFLNLSKHNRWAIWISKNTAGSKPQSFNPAWRGHAKYLKFQMCCTVYKIVKHLILFPKHQESWLWP